MDQKAPESIKNFVISSLESTNTNLSDMQRSLDIAFDILINNNAKIVSFSPPEPIIPMLIFYIDADIESVVDMNFELADAITLNNENEVKYPVYFSKSGESLVGISPYAN